MRLAVYGAASTVVGVGVILSAFNQRANFYSAAVYLAQSNACLMILTNLLVLISIVFGHALQRLFYGPLRAIEVEQIYEKAWYAVTETCLAMTIFRDEFDVRFIIMFGVLLFVKCFSWIGQGRVEFMEQQPPERPVLFHVRLASSLVLLCAACAGMMWHSATSVLDNGSSKPNMMVMFAFEFAILLIVAMGIMSRYVLSLVEKWVLHKEAARRKAARVAARETRKRELEAAKAEVERRRAAGEEVEDVVEEEEEDEDDEDELDVGGWEEKGTWVFYSELCTDFLKLLTYLSFFSIVVTWYGLPLHIIRDVYITLRSFITRIRDFVRYRRATAHMNSRYPDATEEEVAHAVDCIICREGMRAWSEDGAANQAPGSQDQRTRAKKLPCGHVLHFACLRSWLERQQRCPTCRRPVLDDPLTNANADANANRNAANANANGVIPPLPPAPQPNVGFQAQFGIGALGFDIGVGGPGMMQNFVGRMNQQNQNAQQQAQQNGAPAQPNGTNTPANAAPQGNTQPGTPGPVNSSNIAEQIETVNQLIQRDRVNLTSRHRQLLRLRELQQQGHTTIPATLPIPTPTTAQTGATAPEASASQMDFSSIPPHTPGLPAGMSLPTGWNIIPLSVAATVAPESSAPPLEGVSYAERAPSNEARASSHTQEARTSAGSTDADSVLAERIRVLRQTAEDMVAAATQLENLSHSTPSPSTPTPTPTATTTTTTDPAPAPPTTQPPAQEPTLINLSAPINPHSLFSGTLFPREAQEAIARQVREEAEARTAAVEERRDLVSSLLQGLEGRRTEDQREEGEQEGETQEEEREGPSREEKGKGVDRSEAHEGTEEKGKGVERSEEVSKQEEAEKQREESV